jgi:hypothetical protein
MPYCSRCTWRKTVDDLVKLPRVATTIAMSRAKLGLARGRIIFSAQTSKLMIESLPGMHIQKVTGLCFVSRRAPLSRALSPPPSLSLSLPKGFFCCCLSAGLLRGLARRGLTHEACLDRAHESLSGTTSFFQAFCRCARHATSYGWTWPIQVDDNVSQPQLI